MLLLGVAALSLFSLWVVLLSRGCGLSPENKHFCCVSTRTTADTVAHRDGSGRSNNWEDAAVSRPRALCCHLRKFTRQFLKESSGHMLECLGKRWACLVCHQQRTEREFLCWLSNSPCVKPSLVRVFVCSVDPASFMNHTSAPLATRESTCGWRKVFRPSSANSRQRIADFRSLKELADSTTGRDRARTIISPSTFECLCSA